MRSRNRPEFSRAGSKGSVKGREKWEGGCSSKRVPGRTSPNDRVKTQDACPVNDGKRLSGSEPGWVGAGSLS